MKKLDPCIISAVELVRDHVLRGKRDQFHTLADVQELCMAKMQQVPTLRECQLIWEICATWQRVDDDWAPRHDYPLLGCDI